MSYFGPMNCISGIKDPVHRANAAMEFQKACGRLGREERDGHERLMADMTGYDEPEFVLSMN